MKNRILIVFLILGVNIPVISQQLFNYDTLSTYRILERGLDENYSIKLKKHIVEESRGQMVSARGFLNPQLSLGTNQYYGTDPTVVYKDSYSLDGQLLLPTRLGMKFFTGFKLSTETDIISGVPNVFPTAYMPVNESGMWAGVSMPILRDFGKNNTSNANLLSSVLINKAQNIAFTDEICQFIKNSLTSYYNVYERVKIFKILSEADAESRQYLSDIQSMIDNEQIAQVEIYRATAHQLNISQQFLLSRNEIVNSLFDLITATGTKGKKTPNQLPVFLDSLPDPASFAWEKYSAYVYKNMDSMLVRTPYYKSQEMLTSSSEISLNAAKHNKLNELTLDMKYFLFGTTAYQPFSDFNQTFSSNSPGSSFNLTLTYKLPFKNEERKGEYVAKLSAYELNKTQLEKIQFESKAQVLKLLSDLNILIRIYKSQITLADIEAKTYQNEVQKFKMGTSTQIDIINTYMDYNTTMLNAETGRQSILVRIIDLKYLLGDFPTSPAQLINYNPWNFTTK
ncbi:MAG: TolC family protein [Bacteroidota bacterium]